MTEEKNKFCPKCGSDDVKILVAGMTGQGGFHCNNCGYHDFTFPESDEKNLKLIQKEIKNRSEKK